MHDNQILTHLRARLRDSNAGGRILPLTCSSAERFRSASEDILRPMFLEMTQVLKREGLATESVFDLDLDPPVVGISIEAPAISLYLTPSESSHYLTLSTHTGSTGQVVTSTISYSAVAKGRLASIVERALEHAFFPSQPPL